MRRSESIDVKEGDGRGKKRGFRGVKESLDWLIRIDSTTTDYTEE